MPGSIVHEHINATPEPHGLGHVPGHALSHAHISLVKTGLHTQGLQLAYRFGAADGVQVNSQHLGAGAAECQRHRAAYATTGTGDDRDLLIKCDLHAGRACWVGSAGDGLCSAAGRNTKPA